MKANLSSPQDAEDSCGPDDGRGVSLEETLLEAIDREGGRIGQELHDHLCQLLLGAAFSAKAIGMNLPKDSVAAAQIQDLAQLINSAVQQTRDIARGLNPLELDAAGLVPALEELVARPKAGIACRLERAGEIRLTHPKAAIHAYRIAQEAIENAVRHSGATEIAVRLNADEKSVVLEIEDNGRGFGPGARSSTGIGVEIMKCRARAIGAKFSVHTSPPSGTRVILVTPK